MAAVKSCCHFYSCVMLKLRNSPEYLVSCFVEETDSVGSSIPLTVI